MWASPSRDSGSGTAASFAAGATRSALGGSRNRFRIAAIGDRRRSFSQASRADGDFVAATTCRFVRGAAGGVGGHLFRLIGRVPLSGAVRRSSVHLISHHGKNGHRNKTENIPIHDNLIEKDKGRSGKCNLVGSRRQLPTKQC